MRESMDQINSEYRHFLRIVPISGEQWKPLNKDT